LYDLLVNGGTIYDGTGALGYPADVGVVRGRIVAVGALSDEAKHTVDASGMAVSPGFIDLHTHSDASFLIDPTADSKVRQGCTLELAGNCGMSFCAPLLGQAIPLAEERWQAYGLKPELDWATFDEYLSRLEGTGSTVNLATQIGHGTVRAGVIGFDDRAPTQDELESMKRLVAEGLDAGALGFSTGLYYAPGSYARTDEIIALASEAANRGKLYSTHMRDESDYSISLFGSVEETISIGRLSGVRVQISHLKCVGPATWGNAGELLDRIDRARAEGLDVAADQYPYTAASTAITGALFPRWAQVGGRTATLANLSDKEFYTRLLEGIRQNYVRRGAADRVVVANHPSNRDLEGLSMVQVAEKMNCDTAEAAIRLYRANETSVILHAMEESDVEVIAGGRWVAVGSDGTSIKAKGTLSIGRPHPRSYGTFPRFLARYVREKRIVPLEEAIRKMTLLPASRLGLTQRGRVAPGQWADLVVFDPATVVDTATFEAPHSYPSGIIHVMVNGTPVVKEGALTGATPGKVLRKFDA